MGAFNDLTGARYGFFTVVERAKNQGKKPMWLCKCDCGKMKEVRADSLKSGAIKSCGCYQKEQLKGNSRAATHGKRKTRLYSIWEHIKQRCFNETNNEFHLYGGRGVTMCDEWRNSFEAFYEWAMANGYADNLTIDRIDNNGNYEPSNCRWATSQTQANNRRNNHLITYNNETHTIAEWARITGLSARKIYDRYVRGKWSAEKTLETK